MPTYSAIRNKGKGKPSGQTDAERKLFSSLAPAEDMPSREEMRAQIAALPDLNANVQKVSRADLERLRREAAEAGA